MLERRGVLDSAEVNQDPVLLGCAQASMQQRQLFGPGAGEATQRTGEPAPPQPRAHALSAANGGFTLHAATRIEADDRDGLERLLRYIARPPIPADRLHLLADGLYRLDLKHAWADGTTAFYFEPLDLLAAWPAWSPPPAANSCATTACSHPRRSAAPPSSGTRRRHLP